MIGKTSLPENNDYLTRDVIKQIQQNMMAKS